MVARISDDENERVKKELRKMIDKVKTFDDCIETSQKMGDYVLQGYKLDDLESELYYRKERWLRGDLGSFYN